MNHRTSILAASLCGLALGAAPGARAEVAGTAPIPPALNPPAGQALALTALADGVQIYGCSPSPDDPALFAWTLKAPEANLRTPTGKALGRHYAGPTWEATDGSKVQGELVTKLDAPDGAGIPWLLLRAKTPSGSGAFAHVLSIQRVATVGGRAPADGCDKSKSGSEIRVPYRGEYRFYGPADSPVGLWKTFDDKTGQPKAIVRIYEQDGKLNGLIEQSFKPGAENRVCVPCTDERKNQPVIGLVIIRNLLKDGDEYDGGDILDPESGSVYHCKMHVEQGNRLVLRGYIGFSLLGRTQTWERQT